MKGDFVADSSIAIGWVHPSQGSALTRALLEEVAAGASIHVPSIWHLEIANGLLGAVRRKLMSDAQRRTALALLSSLKVVVDETHSAAFGAVSELAVTYTLSAYDASYLELARRMAMPLGTRDEALRVAARKCGVNVL